MSKLHEDSPDCHDAVESMYLFLDDECSDEERAKVRAHLEECIPCLEAFEFEMELKQVVATKCRDEMPPHLVDAVRARLLIESQNPLDGSDPKN